MERTHRLLFWAVLIAALSARLTWVLRLPADQASLEQLPDQREYLELGVNLSRSEGLKFYDPRFDDVIYAHRMPGYPLLIAACGGDIRVVRIVQSLLDTSSLLAVFLMGRLWLSPPRVLCAAAMAAINPFLIYFCGLLLSETLFATMLMWGMTLLMATRLRIVRWCGVLLLALSILVRPTALALPTILACVAFAGRRWFLNGLIAAAITMLVLTPWAWRNHRVLGSWIWTTTSSGIGLYDGLNPSATGASDQSFVRSMPELQTMNELERCRYLHARALEFVAQHPIRALKLAAVKIARMWSPVPLSSQFGTRWSLVIVGLVYMTPFYILILLGLWRGTIPRRARLYLVAPAAWLTLLHAVAVGSLRYRIPADVPMMIVAASAIGLFRRRPAGPL